MKRKENMKMGVTKAIQLEEMDQPRECPQCGASIPADEMSRCNECHLEVCNVCFKSHFVDDGTGE